MPVNRQAALQQRQGFTSVESPPLPAPVGGLNTRDSLSEMAPTDAIILENWFPDVNKLVLAKDYTSYETGLGGIAEVLVEYHAGTTRKFLAATGGSFYDISTSGSPSLLASSFNSARWNHTSFNARLFFVNGEDDPQVFDGSTLTAAGFTGSGLTVSDLIGVAASKNRLYFIEKDSQDFWYGGLNSVTGTLTKFQLSLVGRVGGNLTAIKTISRDAGDGADDLTAFFMTSGEVFVYQGSDPGDASAWSLVGRYTIGSPIDQNAILEFGSDILVVNKADVFPFTDILNKKPNEIIPSKLSGAISEAAKDYSANYGWQAVYFPEGNKILINIPVSTGNEYFQYGINTITNAGFKFTHMNAATFGTYNGDLYFAGVDGTIYKAEAETRANSMTIRAQQAFSNLGSGRNKKFTQMFQTLDITGSISFTTRLAYDYGDPANQQDYSTTAIGTPWGSPWGSPWTTPGNINQDHIGAIGQGIAVSLWTEATVTAQECTWYNTKFKYQPHTRF
jgi:hypothetical protein